MNLNVVDSKKLSAMTIGTVQLGMNYGIANDGGKPDEKKSFSMLRASFENGVTALDTARAYGDSEDVIGRFLKTWEGERPYIATKIRLCPDDVTNFEKHAFDSIETSLEKLGVDKVDTLMLHSPKDLFRFGADSVRALENIQKKGYSERIGVSVYTGEEIEEMLKYPSLSVTQVPMSIFDQRLIVSGALNKLSDREYVVFVRSVFLQGLFFLDPDNMTDPILVKEAAPKIRILRDIARAEGMSIAELAIAFMRDTAGVTSLVLGADTPEQVKENIAYFETLSLSDTAMRNIRKEFSDVDIPEIMKVLSRPKS